MPTFLCLLHRSGPSWDPARPMEGQSQWPEHAAYMDELVASGALLLGGPLADEHRVVLVVRAVDEQAARALFANDPWSDSHLVVASIDAWTIRLARDDLR